MRIFLTTCLPAVCVLRFGPSCDSLTSLAQQQQANPCDKPVPNINKFESPFVAIQPEKDKPTLTHHDYSNKKIAESTKPILHHEKRENDFVVQGRKNEQPMSYFEKVKQEIEESETIFEKVKKDLAEKEPVSKKDQKVQQPHHQQQPTWPAVKPQQQQPTWPAVTPQQQQQHMVETDDIPEIVFNFEQKLPKQSERNFGPKPLVDINGRSATPTTPPPLPPRPCTLQSKLEVASHTNSPPTLKNQDLHSIDDSLRQNETGPQIQKQDVTQNNQIDNNTNVNKNNVCTVVIGSGNTKSKPEGMSVRFAECRDVPNRILKIPVPERISNIVNSGHAPNLFHDFHFDSDDKVVEMSVDTDTEDISLTEPLEIERDDEPDSFSTPIFSRRADDLTLTEPLAIVQEPVSYQSPPFSRRVRDCDDDSAILIDEEVELEPDQLVPAVRVEIYDDFDDNYDLDDFPSFHNNASVVRPFGSDVLSAITEEDKVNN